MESHATGFGLFIQKLNIIRDFRKDQDLRHKSFWPSSYFSEEKNLIKILNRMCYETLTNDLPHAIDYFNLIPPGNEQFDYFIRFILKFGIEFLAMLKSNFMVFLANEVKLPRRYINSLYSDVISQTREEFKRHLNLEYTDMSQSY